MQRIGRAQWMTPPPCRLYHPYQLNDTRPGMDAELICVLSKAVEELRSEYCQQAPCQRVAPFFLKVHDKLTKSWHAPYSVHFHTSASTALTAIDNTAEKGYEELPPLEEAMAGHPSKPCRTTSALAGCAYTSAGQVDSTHHGGPPGLSGQTDLPGRKRRGLSPAEARPPAKKSLEFGQVDYFHFQIAPITDNF